jgi:hypothetical protein
MALEHEFKGLGNLFNGLVKFRFAGVLSLDLRDQSVHVF